MISNRVWRKGWGRKAAATQAASRELAALIEWCEGEGLSSAAENIRRAAMEGGAVKALAALHTQLRRKNLGAP